MPSLLRRVAFACAVLGLASESLAVIKTYTADADQSTNFPQSIERRIYRGDCDAGAATPNAGDDFDDQCTCTPGVNCGLGELTELECAGSGSEGRPNGGACDPAIAAGPGSCPPGFPTYGSDDPPCNHSAGGTIVIHDTGNGTPTLQSLRVEAAWDDILGGESMTGIPGATMQIHQETTLGVFPNQTGTGSTASAIHWGALQGWTQTGTLLCVTHCPTGCFGASACKGLFAFEGLGPPLRLKTTGFDTDPWSFGGDGSEFHSAAFEIVSVGFGFITAAIQLGGRQIEVPALPLAALGVLGAGLTYLGAVSLGRKT